MKPADPKEFVATTLAMATMPQGADSACDLWKAEMVWRAGRIHEALADLTRAVERKPRTFKGRKRRSR